MGMCQVVKTPGVPLKLWLPEEEIEKEAWKQLQRMATLPVVAHAIAVMPDVHWGKGAAVGTVVPLRRAVIPACVGVDIGCGMMAVKTDVLPEEIEKKASRLRSAIERVVPVGHKGNASVLEQARSWEGWKKETSKYLDKDLRQKAALQLGSLGGGNHFLEISFDEENKVWVVLHSGSRNVGKTLAERHIDSAAKYLKAQAVRLPDRDLAWLVEGTPAFEAYIRDVLWCQEYAARNREIMMNQVLGVLSREIHAGKPVPELFKVHVHHNYVAKERHFGEELWVTRKGAVRAGEGDYGILPGAMGRATYIVRGKGNSESFESCAHGAGRSMSRTAARKSFSLEDLKMQTQGLESRKDKGVLDEIPSAYKDIETVMGRQDDLVEPVAKLSARICIKGS